MSHTIKLECPQCGSSNWYRYPHRNWVRGYRKRKIGDHSEWVLATSPLEIARCRECGIAFSCFPSGSRQRADYLLPVDADAIERMKIEEKIKKLQPPE